MGLDISHGVPIINNIDKILDYFTLEELSSSPDYIRRHESLIVEREDEEGTVKVMYFKDIGYQRKGMSSKFYTDFENGRPYFDIEEVKMAFTYLQADHIHSLVELEQYFQKFFIDKFIPGESIFYANW